MKIRKLFTRAAKILLLMCLISNYSLAADHLDGPAASSDPAADITDIYAWMQDSNRINLVMNVFPLASETSRFSNSVSYVFHIRSLAAYGQANQRSTVICEFDVNQNLTCEVNGFELVNSVNASSPSGVQSSVAGFKVFAGLRNDPFFFDANNFNTVRATVRDAASSLSFDEAGCPTLDDATKSVLVSSLTGSGGLEGSNVPAKDFFTGLNTLSLVIQADKNLFGLGPLYSVSATTHRK